MPWPRCFSAHNGSLHLQGISVCPIFPSAPSVSHCPGTLSVSLTPPFIPGRAQRRRGESPTCEARGPACLGEQHGDTCNPTGHLGDPGVRCPLALRTRHQGWNGMVWRGLSLACYRGIWALSPPYLPLHSMGRCRGGDLEGASSGCPMDGQGDPHPALGLLVLPVLLLLP